MRLEDIYIDGFGMFYGHKLEKLSQGLNILVGPNEVGKSTIHTFIKRILFGFPTKRSKENPYPPLSGGRHGGRLIVSGSDNKRYVIERYSDGIKGAVVNFPDGSSGGETELSNLLGHANENIFKNIYAFGLKELQDFETLNSGEARDRLYSAGTGVGAHSLSEVQRTLEKNAGDLFKERGSKPEINALFRDIKGIDKDLREIMNDIQNYDNLHKKLGEINRKIKESAEDQNRVKTKFNHITNLITVWVDWRKIQDSKELLKEIPVIETFPERGTELLEGHLKKIGELTESVSDTNEELEKIKINKKSIRVDQELILNRDRIIELQSGKAKFISASKDLLKEGGDLEREKDELNSLYNEIGPDWDDEKLSRFDVSIPAKETVRQKNDALKEVQQQISDAKKEIRVVKREIEKIDRKIEEIYTDTDCSIQPVDEKSLKRQREALQALRAKYPTLKEKEFELRNFHEKEKIYSLLKPTLQPGESKLPLWPAYILAIAGIVSMIIAFIGNSLIVGGSVLVILSIATLVYVFRSKQESPTEKKLGDAQTENLTESLESVPKQIEKLEIDLEKLKVNMLTNARVCGFDDIPESELLETKDTELQGVSNEFLNLNGLKKQKESLEKDRKKSTEEEKILLNKLEELQKKEEQLKIGWEQWLADNGLEPELSPEGTIEIFASIKTCTEKKKSIESLAVRVKRMRDFLDGYDAKISSVLKDCMRIKDVKKFDTLVELEKLTEDLNKAQDDATELKQMGIKEETFKFNLKNLERKIQEPKDALSKLLAKGHAESEDAFRKNAKNWDERNRLEKEILSAEQNIKRFSGEGESYSQHIDELQRTSPERLEESEVLLSKKLKDIESQLSELLKEHGGIQKEIEIIERRGEGSFLRMEKSVNLEKTKKKSEEWSTLILAKTVLRKAIEKYEKERQPGVIKESQSFFSKMTLGRYSRIYAPLDEPTIYAEDDDGSKKDILKLSGGTSEQLYLSLRFGFIREFGKRAESLPIIFDDILVNFDRKRAQAACEAINELKETNQVLFFTCHQKTVDLLSETISDTNIINVGAT